MGKGEGSTMMNFIFVLFAFNIVKTHKSRSLRWAGYVARMEKGRSALKLISGKPTGKGKKKTFRNA